MYSDHGNQRKSLFTSDVEINDYEFDLFRKLIYESSGIYLNETKKTLLQTRLSRRLQATGCKSFYQYYRYIRDDPSGEEKVLMLNAITTNLTRFFRENEHFVFLEDLLIPELVVGKRDRKERHIRIWSAGCSSGEEAYSIGMTILRSIENYSVWDIKILATDISTDILSRAQMGIYEAEKIKHLPPDIVREFFLRGTGKYEGYYKVKSFLKNLIVFRCLNLAGGVYTFQSRFDFIFCRNVMIYFDRQTQEKIVNRFYNCLENGGYLFIGHSESLNGISTPFKYVRPAVYRKEIE